jgi:hypothetical protein
MRDALRCGRLVAERAAISAVVPPDPAAHIRAAELRRSRLQREREDLAAGKVATGTTLSPMPSGSGTRPS